MIPKRDSMDFNPFPGLRPFSVEDSDLFFGRNTEADEVIFKLLNHRFITITGAPGIGKTSLVQGGIIPKILKSGTGASSAFRIISMRPGNDPFGNLAAALSMSIADLGDVNSRYNTILAELQNSENFSEVFRKYFLNENIMLFIDQLEDIFRNSTQGFSWSSVMKFIDSLINSINKSDPALFIIINLRSDYLGECSRYKGLAKIINSSNYLLAEPGTENLRSIIEGPVKYAGAEIDTQLTDKIINEVTDRHDQIPLLQHSLMRTWSHWREHCKPGSKIEKISYDYTGTIENAVSIHANDIYERLNDRGKEICAVMFRTITRRGSDNKGLRQPASFSIIKSVAGCSDEELLDVADKFRKSPNYFITPSEEVVLSDDSLIDLQTDCLVNSWNKLKEWIDAEASSMEVYLRLSEASALYHQGKTGLYRPPELQSAIRWREENKPALAWASQYNPAFERAMVYLRTSERAYVEEEENKVRLQKKNTRRSGIIATIFGVFVLAATGLIILEYLQKTEAERMASVSENLKVEAERQRNIADSSTTVALELRSVSDSAAAAAVGEAETAKERQKLLYKQKSLAERNVREVLSQRSQAIEERDGLQRLRMLSLGKSMSLKSLQLKGQKDLQTLLAYQAYLFNKKNHGPENDADIYAGLYNVSLQYENVNYRSYTGHKGDIRSIAFVPGKKEFFTSGDDGQVLKWSLDKKDQTLQVVYSGSEIVEVLALSPDASWLACGSSNSSIRMIPLKGNNISYELNGHKGGIRSLIFSYDGKYLYSAALDGKVFKWDIAARTSINVTTGSLEISSIDISSRGNYLAGISADGNVVVWNPDNNSENFRIETSGKKVKVIRFNPTSNTLAIGDDEGNVELWDIELRKRLSHVKAHDSQVNDIQFNTSLAQMATAGNDKMMKIYNIKDPADLSEAPITLSDNEGFVLVMQFSPDGQIIISGGSGGGNNLTSRPASVDYLASDICNMVSRNMTQAEWNTYVGKDLPLEKTRQANFNIKVEPILNK